MTTFSSIPLSSVPLQFIMELFLSTQPCFNSSKPSLVGETLPDDSCIPVPFGTIFRTSIVALVGHSSVRYVETEHVSLCIHLVLTTMGVHGYLGIWQGMSVFNLKTAKTLESALFILFVYVIIPS